MKHRIEFLTAPSLPPETIEYIRAMQESIDAAARIAPIVLGRERGTETATAYEIMRRAAVREEKSE